MVRGQYHQAETSLKTYMRLAPRASQGPRRLALLYLVQDRPAEAVPLLLRARELGAPAPSTDPHEPRSDPDFAQAIRLLEDNFDDLEYVGQALIQQGKSDRAVPVLRRAAALAPEKPGPRFWLVRAYQLTGRPDLAEKELATLRRLHPAAADRLSVH
ncbi:MAG TPA: tetratricopeptide repeat protein [Thermoanaerobaculia bacterium]|nr:tetratricopeptide repeat protein [Thermoanaerobaculia bacterium]